MGGIEFSRIKRYLPVAAIAALFLIAVAVLLNPPEQDRRTGPVGALITVDVLPVQLTDYQINLQSYGIVRARTQSTLVAQVSGEVVWVNPQFREGGHFATGDALLRIDSRDYEADVNIAKSAHADAQRLLAEEQAWSEQAVDEWRALGNDETPPPLVSRVPQLRAAKTKVDATRATLAKAELALERTTITAPFDGRILSKSVDIGQVVSPNTTLATAFATDVAEVRLPIKNNDLAFLSMPPTMAEGKSTLLSDLAKVKIHSRLGAEQTWLGHVIRIEGAIDEKARQLHVVAQVDSPFWTSSPKVHPLKIGEYVTAEIEAAVLDDAVVIPTGTIYQGLYVYVVEESILKRRDIEIAWQNEAEAVVASGLSAGELLVTTPLGQVASGTRVQVRPPSELGTAELESARDAANNDPPSKNPPKREKPS